MSESTARTAPLEIEFALLRRGALAQAREHDLAVVRDDEAGLALEAG